MVNNQRKVFNNYYYYFEQKLQFGIVFKNLKFYNVALNEKKNFH